jgi:HAMP domain-containing protein
VGVVLVLTDVTEQVSAERMALVTLFLVALVVLLLTFGAAAWFLRSEIIGPLVALSDQANEISMGNVDRKLETTRTDEIGMLIQSFERMRLSLKKAFSMLSRKPPPPPPAGGVAGTRN